MTVWGKKKEQIAGLIGSVFNTMNINSDKDAPSINAVKSYVPSKDNLLINSDFKSGIINQMGKSSYVGETGRGIYGIDMWMIVDNLDNKVDIHDRYVSFTIGNNSSINQYVYNIDENENYTFAIKLKDEDIKVIHLTANNYTGTLLEDNIYVVLRNFTDDANQNNDFQLYFANRSGSIKTLNIEFIKLEKGSYFTGMPDWNESAELLKCYLNQYALGTGWGNQYHVRSDESSFRVFIQTPVRMRKNPSLRDLSDNSNLVVTGSQNSTVQQIPVSNVKSISISDNGVYIDFSLGSFKQIGYGQAVFSGRLLLDANEY